MRKTIDYLKRFFNKKPKQHEVPPEDLTDKIVSMMEEFNADDSNFEVPEVICINAYDENRKSILFVDDYVGVLNILIRDLRIKCPEVFNDFNVLTISTPMAGFGALEYVRKGHKVHYAVLDVTLNGIDRKTRKVIDGVDLYFELLRVNPEFKGVFLSAHHLNVKIPLIFNFVERFKNYYKEFGVENADIKSFFHDKMTFDVKDMCIGFK